MKKHYLAVAMFLMVLFSTSVFSQRNMPMAEMLKLIGTEFKADLVYSPEVLANKTTSYDFALAKGHSLEEVLKAVLYPKGLVFLYVRPNYYAIVQKDKIHTTEDVVPLKQETEKINEEQQKTFRVSGIIVDQKGLPVFNANVLEKGTRNATNSSLEGKFVLTVKTPDAILKISSIGYTAKEVSVGGNTNLQVLLQESNTVLSEIVVTALGVKREEKALGYSVQNVKGTNLQTVKGVDMATSLTGKVSGLTIKNSTEFNASPALEMRGETPLLVIDGIPYNNMTLRDIPTDDIESINMLKGPTAAALYGARGSAGAVMITTRKSKSEEVAIEFNSNTMFNAGFVAIPKTQTSYGHGLNGQIATDYVWGPKLDIGNTALQWNPLTKQNEVMPLVSSGRDNLKNFMESGFVTNNNLNISQGGKNGFFRAGLNQIHNKGDFPNQKLDIYNFTMAGEMRFTDKFSLEAHMGYSRTKAPQIWGSGYGTQGYIYQILMWTGPDYDIRQYKDYWVTPNQKQNWLYNAWYDNPYLIAYEKLRSTEQNKLNASLILNYSPVKDLKIMFRNGYDYYKNEDGIRNPAGVFSTNGGSIGKTFNFGFSGKGLYGMNESWGNSINSDLIATYNKTVGDWNFDVLGGGSIFYHQDKEFGARTRNGLAVPGWYSLANAVPSTTAGVDAIVNNYGTWARQVNSLYGKASISWKNAVYLDATGRNDWSSTQLKNARSYFYPSLASSIIMSELLKTPDWLSLWKLRASWTMTKTPLDIYANNLLYTISNSWGNSSAVTPDNLSGSELLPTTTRTWEFGTAAYFFKSRLRVDAAYFSKLYYNTQVKQDLAPSSGYASALINTDETYARRGVEITLDGTVVKNRKFQWNSLLNFSTQHNYYVDIDPIYSAKNPWTVSGKRKDVYAQKEHALRDPQGNIIHQNGLVMLSTYTQPFGYLDPKFTFGFVNNFTMGNFNLGISLDGRIGGIMYNYIYNKMFDTGSAPETDNQYRYDEVVNGQKNYVGNGVKVASGAVSFDAYGNVVSDTRTYAPNDVQVSYQQYTQKWGNSYEHGVKNKSFVKLREVSLGYTMPAKVLGKSGIKTAQFTITGQNLLLFSGFKYSDPDIDTENMNAPSRRMVGMNIKLGF